MRKQRKKKVAVAMSGGVDSGAAAALLVRAGYQCAGFHMKLWQETLVGARASKHLPARNRYAQALAGGRGGRGVDLLGGGGSKKDSFRNKCCDLESLEAARKTAHQLGIPFYVVDLEKIFKKRVVDYFLEEYEKGSTPNPCVMCNRFIKFGELLTYVRKLGYDYLATGHYARISAQIKNEKLPARNATHSVAGGKMKNDSDLKIENSRQIRNNLKFKIYHLLQGADKKKDQSYFLYNLTQSQLAHIVFPVGEYTKKEVVAMAKKWKLPVAERPESQEICFFPESDYRPFLRRQIPGKFVPGEVVDTKGGVIGKHQGLPLYTVGQRHGFEINPKGAENTSEVKPKQKPSSSEVKLKSLIPPFYVIAKDVKKNQLVVGFGKETERKEFWVREVCWIDPLTIERLNNRTIRTFVRIRHQGELLRARIAVEIPRRWRGNDLDSCEVDGKLKRVRVTLSEPERGIAPGQVAVFYREVQRCKGTKVQRKNTLHLCTSVALYLSHEVLGGGIISD